MRIPAALLLMMSVSNHYNTCKYEVNCEYCNINFARKKAP